MKSLNDKAGDSLAVVGKGKVWGLPGTPIHTGASSSNFPGSGMIKLVPDSWYGTLYGTCHQFSNATLLMSGISNTVVDIYPHWSTFLSTAVYGNYGGGLMRSVATGVIASQDYK